MDEPNVERRVDVRLDNAPREILAAYGDGGRWVDYERTFLSLLHERRVEKTTDRDHFGVPTVLLRSEAGPGRRHRRRFPAYRP